MARQKSPAVDAPQSRIAAVRVAEEYAKIEHAIAYADLICDAQIAEMKARRDEIVENLKPKLKRLFDELQAFYSANEDALTGGTKRSVELGPVTIGERLSTPKLKLPVGASPADILRWGMTSKYVRTSTAIERAILIKDIRSDAMIAERFRRSGVTVTQKDEFFVKLAEEESLAEVQ